MRGPLLISTIVVAFILVAPNPAAPQQGDAAGPDPARITQLRDQIEKLRMELDRREERRDLVERQERALYEIALQTGLDAKLSPDRVYPVDAPEPTVLANGRPDLRAALSERIEPADPTGERARALEAYRQWLDRAGRGDIRLESMGAASPEVREMAAAQHAALGSAIEDERDSHDEILRLTGEIRRTIESIEALSDETIAGDLGMLLQSLDDVRAVVQADELVDRASMMDAALEGLLRAPPGPDSR